MSGMARLRVAQGRSTADEFEVTGEMTIGRAAECDVRVFDEGASRRHAIVRREGDQYFAIDQGSTNGTYVNGRRVERHALKTGDEVSVRNLTLVFMDDGAVDRPTVIEDQRLSIASRIEPRTARVRGDDDELLGRLAAVYRFTGVLSGSAARLRSGIVEVLQQTFAPCRAALILPDANVGTFSRSVVEHVRRQGEAVLVSEPQIDLPKASSLVHEKVLCAMAAPLEDYGALYVDRTHGEPFRSGDLELLAALANATTPVLRPPRRTRARAAGAQEILGKSPAIERLRAEIARIASTDVTVLITGETGTGKELVARALHQKGPFVAVNCAAFVDTLLEAELFGHEKGAFTGADRARAGCFEQAHGGTLFLDEVGELAPGLQAKLLRVLETREFRRVGANKTTRVDVRILSATNRDLRGAQGVREDLYYRLAVLTLHCPALREREGDVRLLAETFLGKHRFSDAAIKRLEAYPWPGNVRELKNACDRCAVLADGDVIEADALPLEIRLGAGATPSDTGEVKTLKQMEHVMVIKALDATGGNRTKAAKLLGITYPTLKKKIDEFGVG